MMTMADVWILAGLYCLASGCFVLGAWWHANRENEREQEARERTRTRIRYRKGTTRA